MLSFNILGWRVTEDQLKEAAMHFQVLDVKDDYLEPDFQTKCAEAIPHPDEVKANDCVDAFLYLKKCYVH